MTQEFNYKDLLQIRQYQDEKTDELAEKLLEYPLDEDLKNTSGSLKRKEKKAFKKYAKEHKIDDVDVDDKGNTKNIKRAVTLKDVAIDEDAKDIFIDFLAEQRKVDVDDKNESDLKVWVELILLRTNNPLVIEGK